MPCKMNRLAVYSYLTRCTYGFGRLFTGHLADKGSVTAQRDDQGRNSTRRVLNDLEIRTNQPAAAAVTEDRLSKIMESDNYVHFQLLKQSRQKDMVRFEVITIPSLIHWFWGHILIPRCIFNAFPAFIIKVSRSVSILIGSFCPTSFRNPQRFSQAMLENFISWSI